jgi:copper chaperone NosL
MKAVLAALLLAASGCTSQLAWPPEPAPVALGEDACASCRMIVSDARFAAQERDRAGGTRFYDDVGCLLRDAKARGAAVDPAAVFVLRREGGGWVRATEALAVRSPRIVTPMGSGIAAFGARGAAEAEAKRVGAAVAPLADIVTGKIEAEIATCCH